MLKEELKRRSLPNFKAREEMLEILQEEEYGYMLPVPRTIAFEENENYIPNFCAGKVISKKVTANLELENGEFSFPFYVTIPKKDGKHPFFVCINFRDCVTDIYIPTEEITDMGFAVLSFCYSDITSDDADFSNGLAGVVYKNGRRGKNEAGKLAMWAWAAQRVMDYAQTQSKLDKERAGVCGHSRLGKTALLAAATDERFKLAFSNNSGCSGAAITRGKIGEKVADITKTFPYWFCENYAKYAGRETEMPFDQHWLTACVAPRCVYIASAEEDLWADPMSEMLNCVAISKIYEDSGIQGFVCDDRPPETGDLYHEGSVGYHLRGGLHYFSREDWRKAVLFAEKHL